MSLTFLISNKINLCLSLISESSYSFFFAWTTFWQLFPVMKLGTESVPSENFKILLCLPEAIGWANVYNPAENICSSDGCACSGQVGELKENASGLIYGFKLPIKLKGNSCWTMMLYGEYWTGICQKENKISLVEMKLLKWMSEYEKRQHNKRT